MIRWLASLSRRDIVRGVGTSIFGGIAARLPVRAAQAAPPQIYMKVSESSRSSTAVAPSPSSAAHRHCRSEASMDEASRHYVHLDELMDGVGRRLAQLTQAEWA